MSRYYDDFYTMEDSDYIEHYGVLGMKWGVRRYQPYSYTGGGSGKEIGLAARLKKKSNKLSEKIDKLEKKRTNRYALGTNAKVRGRAGDKQQKLIKKKEKIDKKINEYVGSEKQKKEIRKITNKEAIRNVWSGVDNLKGSAKDVNRLRIKQRKVSLTSKEKKLLKDNQKIADDALNELVKAKKKIGSTDFNKFIRTKKGHELVTDIMVALPKYQVPGGFILSAYDAGRRTTDNANVLSYLKSKNIKDPDIINAFSGVTGVSKEVSNKIDDRLKKR